MELMINLLKAAPQAMARLLLGVGITDYLISQFVFQFGTQSFAIDHFRFGTGLVNAAALIRGETPVFNTLDDEDLAWGLKDLMPAILAENGLVGLVEADIEPFIDTFGQGVVKRVQGPSN